MISKLSYTLIRLGVTEYSFIIMVNTNVVANRITSSVTFGDQYYNRIKSKLYKTGGRFYEFSSK